MGTSVPDAGFARRPRVFGIGLNKTATSSFHQAMTILGFNSLHWGGPPVRFAIEADIERGGLLLASIDPAYDAFSDIEPIYRNYDLADRQYPGSWFVLTTRAVDDWIDSRRRHVERNVERHARGEYHGTFLVVDEADWRREWDEHTNGVRRHFAGHDRFLEVDLTAEPRWERLCAFLGLPEPAEPFPWANRDARRVDDEDAHDD